MKRQQGIHVRDDKCTDNDHKLIESIAPLFEPIVALKAELASLGLFTHDRELLVCPTCNLTEDVTCQGYLIAYHADEASSGIDCGLRFEEIDEDRFRCPVCGTFVANEPT